MDIAAKHILSPNRPKEQEDREIVTRIRDEFKIFTFDVINNPVTNNHGQEGGRRQMEQMTFRKADDWESRRS